MRTSAVRRARDAALAAVAFAGLLSTGVSAGAEEPDGPDGGAKATGGSGVAEVFDQNTALDGRQNNACGFFSSSAGSLLDGQSEAGCETVDQSHSVDASSTADGAEAVGGGDAVYQQNFAEEGRQNNICGNTNSALDSPGEMKADCAARDTSKNKGTVTDNGGAEATGGESSFYQQNLAQEGRQNNACGNTNDTTVSGETEADCVAHDSSKNKGTVTDNGGAQATGGDGDGVSILNEQNLAQEGRQNNACGNTNNSGVPGSTEADCAARDTSKNKGTVTHNGGAEATGGDGLGAAQQNLAQEGRQNNACGNTNNSGVLGSTEADCVALDSSKNKGTVTHNGGAEATGGDSAASLLQQNIAQEGRQNNACGNTSGLSLDSGRTNVQCSAVDESTDVKSRPHHK
ncbi:hypothetical protein [Streptomyces sp. NBC_00019]|uniref:hypothetical protein n=1 Tax=Streptomyces sp. NBC_00019 TaxID=2975623 RepID=UPI003253FFE3